MDISSAVGYPGVVPKRKQFQNFGHQAWWVSNFMIFKNREEYEYLEIVLITSKRWLEKENHLYETNKQTQDQIVWSILKTKKW